jgi:hypothetical protein
MNPRTDSVGAGSGNGSYSPPPSCPAAAPAEDALTMSAAAKDTDARCNTRVTIQVDSHAKRASARRVFSRLRPDPLAWLALAVVTAEAVLAVLGVRLGSLSLLVLLVVPGLALSPLLPQCARRHWSSTLAAVPALGIAAASVALVSAATAGVTLDGTSVRVLLFLLAGAGLLIPASDRPPVLSRGEVLGALGAGAAVVAGVVLHQRVIGGAPVPGNDWGKYALFADEVRAHGSLLIDNPFWMLGVPFREEPGVPALYGAYLELSGEGTAAVTHGIGIFAAVQIMSLFALVRASWGPVAGVSAAGLWAVLPLNSTILGWHGLANAAALALLPLILLYGVSLATGRLDVRAGLGAGLTLTALAAAHRLSLGVGLAALAVTVVATIALGGWRRVASRGAAAAAIATVALSPGVLYDLADRNRTFGGTLDYEAYLSSKLDLGLLVRDLSIPFSVAGGLAAVAALWRVRRDHRLLPVLSVLVVVALLTYAWVAHLPLHYTRMAYYLPLALIPLVAVLVWTIRVPRWLLGAGVGAMVLFLGAVSYLQNDNVDRFYSFANRSSLKGLDAVATSLRPGEAVVTDRCWSFLSTWLVHAPTLAALDPADIQPKAELTRARRAHAVLEGGADGRALARRLRVRYLLVDPTCTRTDGRASMPPRMGRPVFISGRLVILELAGRATAAGSLR